jgi:hypothetical protein
MRSADSSWTATSAHKGVQHEWDLLEPDHIQQEGLTCEFVPLGIAYNVPDENADPLTLLIEQEQRETFDRLLRTLTPREEKALRLHFEDDLTWRQISEILNIDFEGALRIRDRAFWKMQNTARLRAVQGSSQVTEEPDVQSITAAPLSSLPASISKNRRAPKGSISAKTSSLEMTDRSRIGDVFLATGAVLVCFVIWLGLTIASVFKFRAFHRSVPVQS